MKRVLSEILPPIFFRLFENRKGSKKKTDTHLKVFSSYKDAVSFGTYNDQRVADIVAEKTKRIIESGDTRLSSLLAQHLYVINFIFSHDAGKKYDVIEVGGACGAKFILLKPRIIEHIEKWRIIETDLMCAKARSLNISDGILEFYHTWAPEMKQSNICFLEGSLQYIENPLIYLEDLVQKDIEWFYFSRLPLIMNVQHPVISVQLSNIADHGHGVLNDNRSGSIYTPVTYIPVKTFMSVFSLNNYSLVIDVDESDAYSVHLEGIDLILANKGLLFRKTRK